MAGADERKRSHRAPGEHERARAVATVRRCRTDGLLGSREADDVIEQVFRARSLADLDAVLARLPSSPHVAAEVVLSHGIVPPVSKAAPPWWRGMVLWTVGVNVVWLVVWLVTGGGAVWLLGGVILSLIGFTLRFTLAHRRLMGGKPVRRRRLL